MSRVDRDSRDERFAEDDDAEDDDERVEACGIQHKGLMPRSIFNLLYLILKLSPNRDSDTGTSLSHTDLKSVFNSERRYFFL